MILQTNRSTRPVFFSDSNHIGNSLAILLFYFFGMLSLIQKNSIRAVIIVRNGSFVSKALFLGGFICFRILCFSRFWTNPFRVDLVFEGRTVRDTYPSNLQPKKNRAVIAASALKHIAVRRATHPSVQRNYLSEEMF